MAVTEGEDVTLYWALERLLDIEHLPVTVLSDYVVKAVAPEGQAAALPSLIRAKLCLRLLKEDMEAGRVDQVTLDLLGVLAGCELPPYTANPAAILPSQELLFKVRVELGIQTFSVQRGQALPVGEAQNVLNTLFHDCETNAEYDMYQRLSAALQDKAVAQALETEFPFQHALGALVSYVVTARMMLPRSLLLDVQEDMDAGRYVVGAGTKCAPAAAAAALPAAVRLPTLLNSAVNSPLRKRNALQSSPALRQPALAGRGLASPGAVAAPAAWAVESPLPAGNEDDGILPAMGDDYASPQHEQRQEPPPRSAPRGWPRGEQPAVVQQLQAELDNLAQHGGVDPLPEMLGQAAQAQRQAGGAAAAGAGGGGRQVLWDSPAVEHPMPEMQPVRYQRHSPLVQPSPARQQGGRAAAEEQADHGEAPAEQRPPAEEGARRKRVYWTPEEEAELVRLVKEYGRGTWATILEKGNAVFQNRRIQVDLKDKWRNLVKKDAILPNELEEIEAREAEIRREMDEAARRHRRPGRPPKHVTPGRKRQREEEGVDDEEAEEPVQDTDESPQEEEEERQLEQQLQQEDVEEAAVAGAADEEEEEEEEEDEQVEEPQANRPRRSKRNKSKAG